jgi:periplasmic divalent cation tolerance protein
MIVRRDLSDEMKAASRFKLVFVTAPDLKTARRLARSALRARLIACANLVPRIESHYRWQGALERSTEVLLILKTTAARLGKLEKLILAGHPYDTPEFLMLPLSGGSKRYLDWLNESCGRPG